MLARTRSARQEARSIHAEPPGRRAIVLIPELERVERFAGRALLIDNLQPLERRPMQPGEPAPVSGEAGRRVLPLPLRGTSNIGLELVVSEACWADMVTPTGDLGHFARLWTGFELVAYWLFSTGSPPPCAPNRCRATS